VQVIGDQQTIERFDLIRTAVSCATSRPANCGSGGSMGALASNEGNMLRDSIQMFLVAIIRWNAIADAIGPFKTEPAG
jgi:hypothetical protein